MLHPLTSRVQPKQSSLSSSYLPRSTQFSGASDKPEQEYNASTPPASKTLPSEPEESALTPAHSVPSTWLPWLEDLLKDILNGNETKSKQSLDEVVHWKNKLQQLAKQPTVHSKEQPQENSPCPFPGNVSKPWATIDRETIGSDHPDSKRFWEIIENNNTPKDLLDKISKRQVRIGPKGQISFPAPNIKRPKVWWGPPGSQQSKRGQQDQKNGNGPTQDEPQIGYHPGKKEGDIIGKQPAKGDGQGNEGGEGAGDYPKEIWTPPVPRSQVAKLLQAEWSLPFIQPKGQGKMKQVEEIWDATTKTPPNLIERRATLKNAIQRSYAKSWYSNPLSLSERIQNGLQKDSPPLLINRIKIQGNTLVNEKTLQKSLALFQNKALNYQDLLQVLRTLDQVYQKHGYAASHAIITPSNETNQLCIDVREVRDTFMPESIQVHPKDKVRIAARQEQKPTAKTALLYIMDVSGSVSNDMKEMARVQNYFLDTHLLYQYGLVAAQLSHEKYNDKKHFGQGVVRRFIVHTEDAHETSEEEFYTTGQSGGTLISSGFKLAKDIIEQDFPKDEWNIYLFYQGDGDNYRSDNTLALNLLKDMLEGGVNMIGYTHLAPYSQGRSSHSDGLNKDNFYHLIQKNLTQHPNVRWSILHQPNIDEYRQSIQKLLADPKAGVKK